MQQPSQLKPITALGDGNCAFNAFLLAFVDLILSGKFDQDKQRQNIILDFFELRLQDENNWENLKAFLAKQISNANSLKSLQQKYAANLRHFAINLMGKITEEEYNYYSNITFHSLSTAFFANDGFDDIYTPHKLIKDKFEEIRKKNVTSEEKRQILEKWWTTQNGGFGLFLIEMKKSGVNAGDLELGVLARYFGINAQVVRRRQKPYLLTENEELPCVTVRHEGLAHWDCDVGMDWPYSCINFTKKVAAAKPTTPSEPVKIERIIPAKPAEKNVGNSDSSENQMSLPITQPPETPNISATTIADQQVLSSKGKKVEIEKTILFLSKKIEFFNAPFKNQWDFYKWAIDNPDINKLSDNLLEALNASEFSATGDIPQNLKKYIDALENLAQSNDQPIRTLLEGNPKLREVIDQIDNSIILKWYADENANSAAYKYALIHGKSRQEINQIYRERFQACLNDETALNTTQRLTRTRWETYWENFYQLRAQYPETPWINIHMHLFYRTDPSFNSILEKIEFIADDSIYNISENNAEIYQNTFMHYFYNQHLVEAKTNKIKQKNYKTHWDNYWHNFDAELNDKHIRSRENRVNAHYLADDNPDDRKKKFIRAADAIAYQAAKKSFQENRTGVDIVVYKKTFEEQYQLTHEAVMTAYNQLKNGRRPEPAKTNWQYQTIPSYEDASSSLDTSVSSTSTGSTAITFLSEVDKQIFEKLEGYEKISKTDENQKSYNEYHPVDPENNTPYDATGQTYIKIYDTHMSLEIPESERFDRAQTGGKVLSATTKKYLHEMADKEIERVEERIDAAIPRLSKEQEKNLRIFWATGDTDEVACLKAYYESKGYTFGNPPAHIQQPPAKPIEPVAPIDDHLENDAESESESELDDTPNNKRAKLT